MKIDFAALEGGAAGFGLKKICKSIIDNPLFGPFFTMLIIVNTLLLSMEYSGMPADYARALEICNLVLTISFIIELVLKVGGLGFNEYAADRFNLFDAAVVLISIIELAAAGSGSLSALRAFRILRVLKLIRSWTSLQNFLYTVYLTVLDLGNFSFIVFLAIFIFALLGMQLFGGKMCGLDDGEVPRHNFDTLLWALVTVFQVLTGEDWNAVMYDGMAANGSSALYFVLLLVIGNFLVLNLFIAILLTNFGQQEISEEYESTRKVLESISFFKFMSKEKKKKEEERGGAGEGAVLGGAPGQRDDAHLHVQLGVPRGGGAHASLGGGAGAPRGGGRAHRRGGGGQAGAHRRGARRRRGATETRQEGPARVLRDG